MAQPNLTGLDALFAPRAIAVIGASSNPDKISGMPVAFLKQHGYRGAIYPINPRAKEIQGLPAHASLAAVGQPVDLAICAVGAELVEGALEDAARAGVRAMVMFSSGFAETGAAGEAAQQRVLDLARRSGMRLLGPNCLGLMSVHESVYATFSPALYSGVPRPGPIAVASQSGAFGIFALVRARMRGLGISHFVSTGNEADVELADCIAYLADDPAVKVVLGYMEGARDGEKLVAALEHARRKGKPVAICKVGSSALGASAAASHTASLAGRDEVYDAIFRQLGVYRAQDVDELFDIGYACAAGRYPAGRRLGVISISGGAGVAIADAAEAYGLDLPAPDDAAQKHILERVPFAATANPVDITGQVLNDLPLLGDAVEWMLEGGRFDAIVSFQAVTGITPQHRSLLGATWGKVRAAHPELPAAVVTVFDDENRRALEEVGVLAIDEPRRAVRAIAALAGFRESFARGADALPPGPPSIAAPAGLLDEPAALALLRDAGFPVVPHRLVATAAEAAAAAAAVGFPVALKVVSPEIAHKSDIGGVALNLATADAVRTAFERVTGNARAAAPGAVVAGALVAPMIRGGVECILGVSVDPVFGPIVMFGLGGILVEVLKDVTFRRAPFSTDEAHRMIREIRAYRVLEGVRGAPPADIDALAATLARLSAFAAANASWLGSIDVNPFIVLPRGAGAFAVDALVVKRGERPI